MYCTENTSEPSLSLCLSRSPLSHRPSFALAECPQSLSPRPRVSLASPYLANLQSPPPIVHATRATDRWFSSPPPPKGNRQVPQPPTCSQSRSFQALCASHASRYLHAYRHFPSNSPEAPCTPHRAAEPIAVPRLNSGVACLSLLLSLSLPFHARCSPLSARDSAEI